MEHKSSSEDIGPGSMYWRKLQLDAQIAGYLVGARALGFEPDAILYDVLRKPALRPYEVNSKRSVPESPEEYRDRCIENIAEKPDHYYQRGVVVRLEDERLDAAYDAWQTAEQIRLARNANRWPRNVDACSQYNRLCEYWAACAGESTIDDPLRFERGEVHRELDAKHHLPMLTASSARAYRACARKYFFAYEQGVRAKQDAGTLAFGKRVHRALEAWLSRGYDLDAALATVRAGTYDHESAKLEAMIVGYHVRWSDEPLEVLAVEKEFVTDLTNPATGAKSRTWVMAGRIDAIVRRPT